MRKVRTDEQVGQVTGTGGKGFILQDKREWLESESVRWLRQVEKVRRQVENGNGLVWASGNASGERDKKACDSTLMTLVETLTFLLSPP